MDFSVFYASFGRDFSVDAMNVLPRAAALGFDALEVSVNDFVMAQPESYIAEMKQRASDLGMKITCCGGGLTDGCDISSENEYSRRKGIDRLKRVLGIAKALGSSGLDGINYVPWNSFTQPVHKMRRFDQCVKSMKEIAIYCGEIDIDFAVEVANRHEVFMLNTVKEAIDLCEAVGSPGIKIQLDTYHMNIEEDDMYQAIVSAGKRLYSLHVSENNRKIPRPGGSIPWDKVAKAVNDIGFDGYVDLEPFLFTGGEIMYSSKIWRDNAELSDESFVDYSMANGLKFIKCIMCAEKRF